jgi:hypothetical protein
LTPEARARQSIDALLVAACWGVEHLMQGASLADFDRRLFIIREVEAEVDANFKRSDALRQAIMP